MEVLGMGALALNIVMGVGLFVMNNAQYLVGVLIPPVVDILNRDVGKESERYLVTLLVCLAFAVILHLKDISTMTPDSVFASLMLIFIESQTVFKLYFKNSHLREKLMERINPVEEKEIVIPSRIPLNE